MEEEVCHIWRKVWVGSKPGWVGVREAVGAAFRKPCISKRERASAILFSSVGIYEERRKKECFAE